MSSFDLAAPRASRFTPEFLADYDRVQEFQQTLTETSAKRYAKMAADYVEVLTERLSYVAPVRVAELFKQLFPAMEGQRILETGVGTGLLGVALSTGRWDLTGLDVSQAMLDRVPPDCYSSLVCHDACKPLPFPDGYFQGAVAVGLSEYILDVAAWFRAVARVLSPGAPWVFTYVPSGHDQKVGNIDASGILCHSPEWIDEELTRAGFVDQSLGPTMVGYVNGGVEVIYQLSCSYARSFEQRWNGERCRP